MNKLVTFVLAASAFGLANAATQIATPAEFVSAMTTNPAGDYVLTANIDLADAGYSSIATFSGCLDGAGHTISGLGAQALFQDCASGAAVSNVTIDGTVDAANTERSQTGCGVFADTATGATFVGCVVKGYKLIHDTKEQGQTAGNGFIVGTANLGCSFTRCLAETGCIIDQNGFGGNSEGGIVGLMLLTTGDGVQGRFSACTNRAQIASTNGGSGTKGGLGGIVGYVRRPSADKTTVPTVEFVDCVNEGDIIVDNDSSATMLVGGIAGHLRGYNIETWLYGKFINCINRGNVATSRYSNSAGGMLGLAEELTYTYFDSCVNRGNLGGLRGQHAGGMLARCNRIPGKNSVVVINCANYGNMLGGVAQGGLIGTCDGVGINGGEYSIRNSVNYGTFGCDTTQNPVIGELIAKVSNDKSLVGTVMIDNCWRKGEKDACGSVDDTYTVTTTHEQTSATAAATAASALNAVAREASGYVQWNVGTNDYPELYIDGALGPEPKPVAALSNPKAALSRDGSSVTCSVEVASVTVEGGVLRLVVDGSTVKSWTLEAGTNQYVMLLKLGQEYAYSFVAEESTPNPYTTVSIDGGSFTALGEADWFDVKFADAGYVPGDGWMTNSTDRSGGRWKGVAGETALDADSRTVSFLTTNATSVYYIPSRPSRRGTGVVLRGRMLVDEAASELPADVPFALGFELYTTAVAFRPVVYVNGEATAFGEATLGWKSWADFTIEGEPTTEDCKTWKLRVTVGSAVGDWVTLTVPKANVTSLGYSGGAFGDVSGILKLIRESNGFLLLFR